MTFAKPFAGLIAALALVPVAAVSAGPALAQAQAETAPVAAPVAAPAEASPPTPRKPIPYSALQPRRPTAAPRPATSLVPGPVTPAPVNASSAPARPATASPAAASAVRNVTVAPAPETRRKLARSEPLPPAELEAFVDGVVRDAMDREHIAGVTVAIVQNGQVVLKKGYGAASFDRRRAVDPDRTLFRIGSISKTFTWIALMREVEAGRMRIDAPINLYLPEPLHVPDQGYRAQVTVLNLMDHSAGFEDRALGHLMERNPDRERSLYDYLRQERPRRVRAPGMLASYSNYGAGLAGEAVSYVTGRPFETVVEDEILKPLGMAHSSFREIRPARQGLAAPLSPTLAADMSDGFRWTGDGFVARPFEYVGHLAPAGAGSSTAGDMARYMLALLGGGSLEGASIFGPRTAQAFATPLRRTPDGINGWRHGFIDYALPDGLHGFGHDGATLSFLSSMVMSPDLNLGVFISTNTETGGALTGRFARRVIQEFYAPAAVFPRAGNPGLPAVRALYEGHYLGTRRAYGGLEGAVGRIMAGIDVDVTPDGRLVTAQGGVRRAWVPDGDPSSGRFVSTTGDEKLVFMMENGRADRFLTGMNTAVFERTGPWNRPGVLLVLALLTAICAVSTLGGILVRNRREFRETSIQGRASLIQNLQAALWIAAFALVGAWLPRTSDIANVMYGWPEPGLLIASACCIVSAILTLLTAAIVPGIWRGGRRVDSWTGFRKTGFTATVLIYLTFSAALLVWGVLTPWVA